MRKTLVVAALIAAGAGGYYIWQQQQALPGSELLQTVPGDTVLFSAQLQPVDLTTYLASMGVSPNAGSADNLAQLETLLGGAEQPAQKFLLALSKAWLALLQKPAELAQTLGLKAQQRSLFYMVGISPVAKLEVADEARFWQFFDQVEQDSGFAHEAKQLDGQAYRAYNLQFAEDITLSLLVRVHNGWLTLAFTSDKLPAARLSEVLGTQPLADNLAASPALLSMQQKYQLNPAAFGYVSFPQLSAPLVSKDANRLAQDVTSLFDAHASVGFADWRNAACQTDVAAITKTLPGLFVSNQVSGDKVSNTMLFAIDNANSIAALQQLQGFVPDGWQQGAYMLQLGLGLDVGQLSAGVGKLWDQVTTSSYQCAPLVSAQQQLKESNPLPMLMMAGMANGLQGMALTVNDLEVDLVRQMPKSLDAMLSLSGDNLLALLESAKALRPELASVTLPKAGETLDLTQQSPELQQLGIGLKLQATDKHLVLFSGPQAAEQAKTLGAQPLSKNGFATVSFDYGKFFKALEQAMQVSGEPIPPELAALKDHQQRLGLQATVTTHGIQLNSNLWLQATKAQ